MWYEATRNHLFWKFFFLAVMYGLDTQLWASPTNSFGYGENCQLKICKKSFRSFSFGKVIDGTTVSKFSLSASTGTLSMERTAKSVSHNLTHCWLKVVFMSLSFENEHSQMATLMAWGRKMRRWYYCIKLKNSKGPSILSFPEASTKYFNLFLSAKNSSFSISLPISPSWQS